eukprot:UN02302
MTYSIGFIVLFSLDAMPLEIFSHKSKAYLSGLNFAIVLSQIINLTLYSERKHMMRLGGREWDLESIRINCGTNIALFFGKIVWTFIHSTRILHYHSINSEAEIIDRKLNERLKSIQFKFRIVKRAAKNMHAGCEKYTLELSTMSCQITTPIK